MMAAIPTKQFHTSTRYLTAVVWGLSSALLCMFASQSVHANSCAVSDFTMSESVAIVEVHVVPPVQSEEGQNQRFVSNTIHQPGQAHTRGLVEPSLVLPGWDALVASTTITGENVILTPGEPMVADLMIDGGTIMNVSGDTLQLTLSTGDQVILGSFQTLAVGQISKCTVSTQGPTLSLTSQTGTATFPRISSAPKGCGWSVVFGSAFTVPSCAKITSKKLQVSDAILTLDVSACAAGTQITAGIDIKCTCAGAIPNQVGFQVDGVK